MELTFVNVGYGEAMVLTCPSSTHSQGQFVMVIDGGTGNPQEYTAPGRMPLHAYLKKRNVNHIDVLVNTHIHEDHICGVLPVIKEIPIFAFWQTMPEDFYKSMVPLSAQGCENHSVQLAVKALNAYRDICHQLIASGATIVQLQPNMSLPLPIGLGLDVLSPSVQQAHWFATAYQRVFSQTDAPSAWDALVSLDSTVNNASLMLLLSYAGRTIFLPGDTNLYGYGEVSLEKVDVFKVGHHCQADGISAQQLDALQPSLAICTGSSDRRYNSVHPSILDAVRQRGGRWYYTDCLTQVVDAPPIHSALTVSVDLAGTLEASYQ